jgi:lipoprotein-releasing system permease protein
MKLPVNYDIALTHILTRKKQTLIAAMGVTIGIALYIFSNSLVAGFGTYSRNQMFKTFPNIKIYKEDQFSKPLFITQDSNAMVVITNPKIGTDNKNIINPYGLIETLQKQSFIISTAPQVNVDLFYSNGKSQVKGLGSGIDVVQADKMFDIQSTMLAGNLQVLTSDLNGIIIGQGVAQKLNVGLDDNITVTSSRGVIKVMKVKGIFSVGNKITDESKSYINIKTAQQLIKEGPNYVTDIYANVSNPDSSLQYAARLQELTEYKVEDWKITNADQLAQDNLLGTMTPLISYSIMLVAAFGIYNILNMIITSKMSDIAILKANGFKGKDIVKIFVSEAFIMGVVGIILGLSIGAILIEVLSRVYIGEPIGYFPVYYDAKVFITGGIFGLATSLGAGYFPARKAAKVDPVKIFRK